VGIYQISPTLPALVTEWYRQNRRDLPWRKSREPYPVWLSEIMLQQTRVETVKPYYERFLAELPTIGALAAASEEQLYKLWEGLGYYSRARSLQKAAGVIMREYGGVFPREHEKIIKLPGIGPYTAGAVASICFDAPVPAVDGNVLRVVARLEEITEDVSSPAVKREIGAALARIYPGSDCGDFTQGLMELGATVCLPGTGPVCEKCPVKGICRAFKNGTADKIPSKRPQKTRKREEITVLVLVCGGRRAIRKRGEKGLLAGLWEYPNLAGRLTPQKAMSLAADWGAKPEKIAKSAEKTHVFTHLEWRMRFYLIPCGEQPAPFLWADGRELREIYAIPAAFQPPDFYECDGPAAKSTILDDGGGKGG